MFGRAQPAVLHPGSRVWSGEATDPGSASVRAKGFGFSSGRTKAAPLASAFGVAPLQSRSPSPATFIPSHLRFPCFLSGHGPRSTQRRADLNPRAGAPARGRHVQSRTGHVPALLQVPFPVVYPSTNQAPPNRRKHSSARTATPLVWCNDQCSMTTTGPSANPVGKAPRGTT
jgi:hypothetical protein